MKLISADNCWHDWLEIVGSCTSHGSDIMPRPVSATLPVGGYNRCRWFTRECDLYRILHVVRSFKLVDSHVCVWRFGLFVLINTTIDRYYCSFLFILRRNWRALCTWSPIHCAGAQFTHDKTVDIQLINTSTHPYNSWPYYAITAFRWNSLRIFTGTTNWVTVRRR